MNYCSPEFYSFFFENEDKLVSVDRTTEITEFVTPEFYFCVTSSLMSSLKFARNSDVNFGGTKKLVEAFS